VDPGAAHPAKVGANLRRLRLWRGKDQATVAGLAGRSQSWVSKIEAGKLALDKRSDIEALANALHVHPSDLTGQDFQPAASPTPEVDALIPAIRVALVDGAPDAPPRPLPELALEVRRASAALWRDGDLITLAQSLPDLYGALRIVAADGSEDERRQAGKLLAVLASLSFPMLKNLGYTDLALVASNLCAEAARKLDDPLWTAYAGFRRSHALIPSGAPVRAYEISRQAADRLQPQVPGTAARLYGMLHLTAALWASRVPDRATALDHLAEAERIACDLTDDDFFDIWFGPTQLAVHRIGIMANLGDGGLTPQLAAQVDTATISSNVHRAFFWADVGRGLAQVRGREGDAVRMLRRSEDLAPQRIRSLNLIQRMVGELIGRPMKAADERELRGLAFRVGIPV
jgi:transcriptional regulator with XRE-family HTH domain